MFDLKPYGAFIENTLRPMLEELTDLAKEIGRYDLIPHRDIPKILRNLFIRHLVSVIMDTLKTIICVAIMGYVAWTISRS